MVIDSSIGSLPQSFPQASLCGSRVFHDFRCRIKSHRRPAIHSELDVIPKVDTVGEFKKWGEMLQNRPFSPLGREHEPPFVLEKNRTSLQKSNSPTVSKVGSPALVVLT